MVNIYHQRRDKFKLCTYYLRDDSYRDLTELVLKSTPQGQFYAKESNNLTEQQKQAGGVILYDSRNIVLETTDDVSDIASENIVVYNGKPWFVNGVQSRVMDKESEFLDERFVYYISIRR